MKDLLHPIVKEFTRKILENPFSYRWTIQGFGMLRLGLSDAYRLNIWDDRYRVPNVSMIHTHPWDFSSLVVVGKLKNIRYREQYALMHEPRVVVTPDGGKLHKRAVIRPGIGGGLQDDSVVDLWLHEETPEIVKEGEIYRQKAAEIHISLPENGTVTLNHRVRVGADIAQVYWDGPKWMSAEPREATNEEIAVITKSSLESWF